MKCRVKVTLKPNSKVDRVEILADGGLRVQVKAPPVEGRANLELCRVLAEHFGIRRQDVELVAGHKSRHKWIEFKVPVAILNK